MSPASSPVAYISGARTRCTDQWRHSVRLMIKDSELVIIDARGLSRELMNEATVSLANDILEKAVFLVSDEKSSKLLDALLDEINFELPYIMIAKPRQLGRWINGLVWKILRRKQWGYVRKPMDVFLSASRYRWERRKPASSLCDDALSMLYKGATANEIIIHINACKRCKPRLSQYPPTQTSLEKSTVRFEVPKILEIGLDGPPIVHEIIENLDRRQIEIAVISADSPGARQPQWTIDALLTMVGDPGLSLVIEDDRISFTPIDPCIVVRTEHLRTALDGLPPATLRELSDRLKEQAMVLNKKYKMLPLVEVVPDLL